MAETDGEGPALGQDGSVPEELSHCGAVVDKAIEYMLGEKLPPIAIASALLGGSLGLLSRTMDQGTMLAMLENAIHSVRSGDLHPDRDKVARPE
ncbi:hypothetical protein HLH36_07510 [Gluconacetobacter aggeris]|uniref:Uncharacterized protein n=1 Tax=Gluconacetobacter aggeris TaxID=1286186 RepID=A0A7W4ISD5_9PROT|nr:hypothetical protein [Gluconacetobacter aggeris]MBB2168200.1 hypothetical protein [Gluconacetobacter aggeris]